MWYNLAINPKSISSVFDNDVPSLRNALLKKIDFDNNGPEIDIFLEVENYPSSPPIKWKQKGYDTAQVWMKLIEVISVKMDGWERNNLVNIQLKEIEGNLLYLKAEGSGCNIEISFRWLDTGVSGYIKGNY
jgi:hypothetical protein